MHWQQVLATTDITVAVVDADHVTLMDAGTDSSHCASPVRLLRSSTPVYPSRIPRDGGGQRTLLVVPTASEATVRAARAADWDVVSEDGTVDVRLLSRHVVRRGGARSDQQQTKQHPGPQPRAKFVVARILMAQQLPISQRELAMKSQTSQPTVSRACAEFRERGFVRSDGGAIKVTDWYAMSRWWLNSYPGAGGLSSYWFALEPIMTQVRMSSKAMPGAVFSGSAAADLLTPWQTPDLVVAYTKSTAPLTDAGFVAVSDPSAATLVVTAAADTSVWCHRPLRRAVQGVRVSLADPLQIVLDVLHGADVGTRDEVVERLLHDLHELLRPAWAQAWDGQANDQR